MAAPMKHVDVDFEDSASNASSDESEQIIEGDDDIADQPSEKAGLADVLSRILGKKTKGAASVILSKGKTDRQLQRARLKKIKEETGKAGSGEESEDDGTRRVSEAKLKKQLWEQMGRKKPDITKKEKERNLQRIATRGVVQLFNAVKKQQKLIEDKMNDAGSSSKRDKVLPTMTKGAFLDVLKNTNATEIKGKLAEKSKITLSKGDEKHKWSVLRDDFMMGAKMKDWDKDSDSDNSLGEHASDISMSDEES